MRPPVRLIIVGFGLVGRRHAEAIRLCPGAEIAAVVETDAEARRAAGDQGLSTFADLGDCLDADPAEGCILSTPNTVHVEQAMMCIAHGVPVLIEKPIATRSKDAEAVIAAAQAANIPLLVGHHRRHNPLIQRAKSIIDAGQIGIVRAVQATCWFYKPDDYFEAADWRRRQGAGPVAVNLVHDVDLIRHLCGEISSVRAAASPSARGYDNEDVASALLEFDNGAIGTITVSDSIVAPWSWEMTSREYPVYPATSENCYMIGGSHGSLSVPDLRLWHYGNGARHWWSALSTTTAKRETTDPLVNQIRNFAAVIRGEAEPVVSGEEGTRTLKVIEAIQHSAATGERVDLAGSDPHENGSTAQGI